MLVTLWSERVNFNETCFQGIQFKKIIKIIVLPKRTKQAAVCKTEPYLTIAARQVQWSSVATFTE